MKRYNTVMAPDRIRAARHRKIGLSTVVSSDAAMSTSTRIQRALAVGLVAAFTAGTAALIAAIAISARRDEKR